MEQTAGRENVPVITIFFVAVNVVMYLLTELLGSSLDADFMIHMGAMYEPAFLVDREYVRIFTHFFLHFGFEHLFNNMVSLLVLGYSLENSIGKAWFGLIYMASGVFAGMVSVWYHFYTGQEVVSCGASGAIYGLMGALLVILFVYRRQNMRILAGRFALYIALSLYSGLKDPGIDNAAHVGGFVGGMVLCSVMCIVKKRIRDRKGQVER